MLMEVYYEHYRQNCKGAYWEERKSLPYMVLERDKAKQEEFKEILKRKGFQCVAWNDSYSGILVNVELKRFGMINRACKHSCVDDRNYSIDEFTVEILGSATKKLYAE
ncbi:MAG: hypothetical protein LUE20_02360 [Oscillospiraceae bacterium]|nr:hypothetical protein [Oscillospiraceae bacterium]